MGERIKAHRDLVVYQRAFDAAKDKPGRVEEEELPYGDPFT